MPDFLKTELDLLLKNCDGVGIGARVTVVLVRVLGSSMHIMDTTSSYAPLVASSDKEFLHPYIFEFLLLSRSTRVVCGSASVCLNGLQNFLVFSVSNLRSQ